MRFTAAIERTGGTTTGIRVPAEVLEALGAGRRPRVVVTLDGAHTHRTTIGTHDGAPFIPVSSAVRNEAGVAGGQQVEVEVAIDEAPREIEVPDDLAAALAADEGARTWFEQLTESQRKGFVTSVTSAKQPDTRRRRVVRAVEALAAGQKRP